MKVEFTTYKNGESYPVNIETDRLAAELAAKPGIDTAELDCGYVTLHTPHGSTTFDPCGNYISLERLMWLLRIAAIDQETRAPHYHMTVDGEEFYFEAFPLWKAKYIWGDMHNPYTAA